jgi:hypothetical protein
MIIFFADHFIKLLWVFISGNVSPGNLFALESVAAQATTWSK